MKPDWTLIANTTRARLLQQEPGAPMVILESFVHPAARWRICDPAGGRAAQDKIVRFGGAACDRRVNAGRGAQAEFARELAQVLEQEARLDHFQSLTIFAAGPFLGEIEAELGMATQRRLAATHELDLTRCGLSELEQRISHETAMPAR